MVAYAVSALRALTYRLTATPTAQLPLCVAHLSASIWACRDLISAPADSLKRSDEGTIAVTIHRLKTQLTALLQDRTLEGRWSAVVLTKAIIEAGGLEVLSKCNGWVRSLLSILKRPDPPTTRALAVLVLTRIFMLTWDHVSLVREITSPALPAFVSTCLSNAVNKHCSQNELLNILEAFEILLPHHPTIFRTNEAVLRALLLRVISADVVLPVSSEHIAAAQRVLSLLPSVVPKQGGAEKWTEGLQQLVEAAHEACDQIFQPVIEPSGSHIRSSNATATQQNNSLALPPPTSISAGSVRMVSLLSTIAAHFETTTQTTVTVNVGSIFNLLSRILAVTAPQAGKHSYTKINPEITREERDLLFAELSHVHIAAFKLLRAMLQRLNTASLPLLSIAYEHATEVFAAEVSHDELRSCLYDLVSSMLLIDGLSLNKDRIARMVPLLQRCCKDASLESRKAMPTAITLLITSLTKLDARYVPRNTRTLMDRTAILQHNKAALLASVLNPPPNPSGAGLQTGLLPILARLYPGDAEVEALIRPRMPVIRMGPQDNVDYAEIAAEDIIEEPVHDVMDLGEEVEEPTAQSAQIQAQDQAIAFGEFVSTQQKRTSPVEALDAGVVKRPRLDEPSGTLPTAQASSMNIQAPSSAAEIQASVQSNTEEFSDAGSDIELPPLTMDPDTDDESS